MLSVYSDIWSESVPGVLITIEGGEGAGKSTQCGLLARWLRGLGHRVTETREPEGTDLGVGVRKLFEETEVAPGITTPSGS